MNQGSPRKTEHHEPPRNQFPDNDLPGNHHGHTTIGATPEASAFTYVRPDPGK